MCTPVLGEGSTPVTKSLTTDGSPEPRREIDVTVAHPARIWDYWLGGKDNFAADREVSAQLLSVMPDWIVFARADREFLGRAVRYLAGEAGIRQFLDIGTGIPTRDNTHEVAQRVAPESRVVYVDNDPVVLAHAEALLVNTPPGMTDYLDADLNRPDEILRGAARTLEFSKPIAVTLLGILEFVTDNAYGILQRLMGSMVPGSHLVIAHPTTDIDEAAMRTVQQIWNDSGAVPARFRSHAEFSRFFDGMELLEPGVVSLTQWRPDPGTLYADRQLGFYCAVGRKP
jgi:trans-aconitate methyltransferase